MENARAAAIILSAVPIAAAFIAQPLVGANVAVHWNAFGQADGYAPKGILVWLSLLPGAMLLVFLALPWLDPKGENLRAMGADYDRLALAIVGFLAYLNLLVIAFNARIVRDFSPFFLPAIAALFFYFGILLPRCRQSWFVGIRTPWTLSSYSVWQKTHNVGGGLFKAAAAIIVLSGAFFPQQAFLFSLSFIVASVAVLYGYSYAVWKKAFNLKWGGKVTG